MSTDAQKQWIERRKSEAKNRHQGRLQVPGTSPNFGKDPYPQSGPEKDI